MNTPGGKLQNQSGQALLETVLLLAITVGFSLWITNYLKENQFAQKLVAQPWNTLTGMIECGTWKGCAKGMHPNSTNRIISLKPDR